MVTVRNNAIWWHNDIKFRSYIGIAARPLIDDNQFPKVNKHWKETGYETAWCTLGGIIGFWDIIPFLKHVIYAMFVKREFQEDMWAVHIRLYIHRIKLQDLLGHFNAQIRSNITIVIFNLGYGSCILY